MESFSLFGISYIAKNTNANTITHYVPEHGSDINGCLAHLRQQFPAAQVRAMPIAIVAVLGSNMKFPGFLSRAAQALAGAGINILALDQCMRQVNMQFMIDRDKFDLAQIALHHEFVEKETAH